MQSAYSCFAFDFHTAWRLNEVTCLREVPIACKECAVTAFFLCTLIGFGDGSVVSHFHTCKKCPHFTYIIIITVTSSLSAQGCLLINSEMSR